MFTRGEAPQRLSEALLAVLAPAQVVETLVQETKGGDGEAHGNHHGRDLVLRWEWEGVISQSSGAVSSQKLASESLVTHCQEVQGDPLISAGPRKGSRRLETHHAAALQVDVPLGRLDSL